MKKSAPIFSLILALLLVFIQPLSVKAAGSSYTTKEYLSDGSYYETILFVSNARGTVTNASKTTTYKNASGESMWYAKVTANFTFNGSSATCTSATASAGSYSSTWKILEKTASRSGNSGTATVRAGAYMGGVYVDSTTKSVTIYCNKNGKVS